MEAPHLLSTGPGSAPPSAGPPAEGPTLLALGNHLLSIERSEGGHLLRLSGPDGAPALELALTPQGPVLRVPGGLRLEVPGALALDAEQVSIHGRQGLALSSGADATLEVLGDFRARAELGDVSIRANDDVRIDGERIRMNC